MEGKKYLSHNKPKGESSNMCINIIMRPIFRNNKMSVWRKERHSTKIFLCKIVANISEGKKGHLWSENLMLTIETDKEDIR